MKPKKNRFYHKTQMWQYRENETNAVLSRITMFEKSKKNLTSINLFKTRKAIVRFWNIGDIDEIGPDWAFLKWERSLAHIWINLGRPCTGDHKSIPRQVWTRKNTTFPDDPSNGLGQNGCGGEVDRGSGQTQVDIESVHLVCPLPSTVLRHDFLWSGQT